MSRVIFGTLLIAVIGAVISGSLLVGCQDRNLYHSRLPKFNLLLIDGVTVFNSDSIPIGRPFMLVYFNSECKSCQEETEDLLKNIKRLNIIDFYFLTNEPANKARTFSEYYSMANYPNIKIGTDYDTFFAKFYRPFSTPYSILYDKDRRLVKIFGNRMKAESLIFVLNSSEKY